MAQTRSDYTRDSEGSNTQFHNPRERIQMQQKQYREETQTHL